MRVNKRDRIAIGVFVLLAGAYAAQAIRAQIAPSSRLDHEPYSRPTAAAAAKPYGAGEEQAEAASPATSEGLTPASKPLMGEWTVLARDPFRPVVATAAVLPGPDRGGAAGPAPGRPGPKLGPNADKPGRDADKPGPDEGDGGHGPKDEPKPAPTACDIVLTGVIMGTLGPKALVEGQDGDKRKKALYVALGEDAFGYTLAYANPRGAVFEANGRAYVLRPGDGKAAVKTEAPKTEAPGGDGSTPGAPGGPGGPGGGGGRSFGGGGYGGGGGWRGGTPGGMPGAMPQGAGGGGGRGDRGDRGGRSRGGGPPGQFTMRGG
jgi:translation initiation factor IF-2